MAIWTSWGAPAPSIPAVNRNRECVRNVLRTIVEWAFAAVLILSMPLSTGAAQADSAAESRCWAGNRNDCFQVGARLKTVDETHARRVFRQGCDLGDEFSCSDLLDGYLRGAFRDTAAAVPIATLLCTRFSDGSRCAFLDTYYSHHTSGASKDTALKYRDDACADGWYYSCQMLGADTVSAFERSARGNWIAGCRYITFSCLDAIQSYEKERQHTGDDRTRLALSDTIRLLRVMACRIGDKESCQIVGPQPGATRPQAPNARAYFNRLHYSPTEGRVGYHMVSQLFIDDWPGAREDCDIVVDSIHVSGDLPPGMVGPHEKDPANVNAGFTNNIEGTPRLPGTWVVTVTYFGIGCRGRGSNGDRAIPVTITISP